MGANARSLAEYFKRSSPPPVWHMGDGGSSFSGRRPFKRYNAAGDLGLQGIAFQSFNRRIGSGRHWSSGLASTSICQQVILPHDHDFAGHVYTKPETTASTMKTWNGDFRTKTMPGCARVDRHEAATMCMSLRFAAAHSIMSVVLPRVCNISFFRDAHLGSPRPGRSAYVSELLCNNGLNIVLGKVFLTESQAGTSCDLTSLKSCCSFMILATVGLRHMLTGETAKLALSRCLVGCFAASSVIDPKKIQNTRAIKLVLKTVFLPYSCHPAHPSSRRAYFQGLKLPYWQTSSHSKQPGNKLVKPTPPRPHRQPPG